jgi:Zn-dependent peptidase ImmA (M78 family)
MYLGSSPPFSLTPLVEYFGIAEVRERPLDRDARLVRQSGQLFIEVNSLFPPARRRLSVAHEIGHLIVDRCSGDANRSWGHEDPIIEALCNRLAGGLLAPDWALRKHFDGIAGFSDWRQSIRCSTILSAASRFGISVDAIACRVFHEMKLAQDVIAIVWRYMENTNKSLSEKGVRVGSAWHAHQGRVYIPRNKTAPANSVAKKAFEEEGVFCREEYLSLGSLKGQFHVEATGFGWSSLSESCREPRGVLSLLTSQTVACLMN